VLLEVFVYQKRPALAGNFEFCVVIVDQKRPALAGIFGSCVAWGFLLTRDDLPRQGFLNHVMLNHELLEVYRGCGPLGAHSSYVLFVDNITSVDIMLC